ncbi:hypothetical protein BKA62DRAFT_713288 [Auriculariales sp. MPI-PUGE-AT-0066]|nr:hypothetical protein BKA62DRAFT_713288 [Auriculariales sp. MPI-PUGE-AT-0066]
MFQALDRFMVIANQIGSYKHDATPQPFTRAYLDAPNFQSLFRQADLDECHLFTKSTHAAPLPVAPVQTVAPIPPAHGTAIERVKVPMATPLRKSKMPAYMQSREQPGPEVYFSAMLKIMSKYAGVRDQSNTAAAVERSLEECAEIRDDIEAIEEMLDGLPGGIPATPKATLKDEERRHRQLQARRAQIARRTDALREQLARNTRSAIAHTLPDDSDGEDDDDDDDETSVWVPRTAPGSARSNLLDEDMDDVGDTTLESPLAKRTPGTFKAFAHRSGSPTPGSEEIDGEEEEEEEPETAPVKEPSPAPSRPLFSFQRLQQRTQQSALALAARRSAPRTPPPREPEPETTAEIGETTLDSEADSTVVLAAPPSTPPPRDEDSVPRAPPSTAKRKRLEVLTAPDAPRIIRRIWQTMGEVLEGDGNGVSDEATIVVLERLATPALAVAFDSAVRDTTPLQNRLIARLLLSLLRSDGPPRHTVPLAMIKAELAAAVVAITAADDAAAAEQMPTEESSSLSTKAVYACVAKRCIRIDRATREQRVGFDLPA